MSHVETIPDLFERAAERYPTRSWLTYEESRYTYEQAHRRVLSVAGALAEAGVERGTKVLATTRNSAPYLFTWLAAMRLGAMFLPVDPASSIPELVGFLVQFDPALVVTDSELKPSVDAALGRSGSRARLSLVQDLECPSPTHPPIAARPDDVAVLIPTSGTTGRSKLVMQTQRAYAMAGEGFPFWTELDGDDRLMTSLPLFHINAPAYSVLGSAAVGAGLILLPRFSGSRFLDEARRYGATEFNAIGAMVEILMRQPERDDDSDNPLRLCYTGPSPSKERQLEIERRFDLRVVSGYALSESPYALIWRRGTRPFGTLGSVRQHPTMGAVNEARVMNGGRLVGPGGVGELELKNPAIMRGYYDMPEETQRVLVDGWLRTGDLVRVNEDDTYTFVGREKEVIRRRGENLSPLEVEAALEGHPSVVEAAVVGVPSELSEEDVKAFVVVDAEVSASELCDFASSRLAAYKVPRYLEFVAELPHTPTGRIAKHRLPRDRSELELEVDATPIPRPKR